MKIKYFAQFIVVERRNWVTASHADLLGVYLCSMCHAEEDDVLWISSQPCLCEVM
jgi:hypothetical protein